MGQGRRHRNRLLILYNYLWQCVVYLKFFGVPGRVRPGNRFDRQPVQPGQDKSGRTKVCKEKTLDTLRKMLYDTQGDDEWKKL